MTETLAGIVIILASGLIGRDILINEQPSLKTTLHHLEAYQDVIGLFALFFGLFGLYHSLATGLLNVYTPIYWCLWSISNVIAINVGLTLCFPLFQQRLDQGPHWLALLFSFIETKVRQAPNFWCWFGLILGTWRLLFPWLSS